MAPTPQEIPHEVDEKRSDVSDGDRVVISGISGGYPSAKNTQAFSDILYNKDSLQSELSVINQTLTRAILMYSVNPAEEKAPRWNYDHPEVPQYCGLIPDLDEFDAQFFRVHHYMGINMDPMSRKILEHAYQAIYDAGLNPASLSGKKIGVYIGSCLSETEKTVFYNAYQGKTGLGIAGCNKSMFANRVSYWLNAKGPSLAIDAACCGSAVAIDQAYQAMRRGDCEAAVVGGCNTCLHPQTSVQMSRNITLCTDGKTKSYDQAADGCVRSEAVTVLFLQRAKDALRIYSDVVHVKTKFVSNDNIGTFQRKPEAVVEFIKEFYNEIKISPTEVEYVEGFGSADPDCDKIELEVFDKVFSPGRSGPLNIGSVILRHGLLRVCVGQFGCHQVLLGYHTGQLAGSLHCLNPRQDVAGLREGRLRVLQDHTPTNRSYIAINGLSVTGINSHILLHGHYKPKNFTKYESSIPRLVLISGRTDAAVTSVINNLKSRPIDAEELALIHNIHSSKVNGHLGRGFAILDTDNEGKTTSLKETSEYFDAADRPLWFVYSGMGSQWAGMGAQLMRIPIFAAAIERCRRVLEPKGLDIVHIITSPDKTIYDNILHSFVGIAACQIGLTDILHALGLVPDKIIGHSVGELGCAYADGCLTAEEMILAAYSRGLVSVETPFIRGSMAAVGIGYEEVSKMCPPEIEVACHNSPDSSTISGPADVMAAFVSELSAKSIFAKEVPCSNIAYHSRYIAEAGPGLLKYLKEVIRDPKPRSERWVSSLVPQERWNEDLAKYSSAEYHTNNLLSPVLFEEASRLIPSRAVLVEVAPHGLLQAILKRALPGRSHVPLTHRAHPDNVRLLLEAIGQLFMEGYYPDIRALYPKVEFPVSTGTPHLSHLVEWAHQQTWHLALYASPERASSSSCTFKITLNDDEHTYLLGHRIRDKTVFPFASALVCAWDTLAMSMEMPRRKTAVQLRDVSFFSQPTLHDSRLLRLTVAMHRGTGRFEIDDGITKVASGVILLQTKAEAENTEKPKDEVSTKDYLKTDDIYEIFNERGYMYTDGFRSIREVDASFTNGVVSWNDNWATFLDSLLQFNTLRQPHDDLSQPGFIREINIDPEAHAKSVETGDGLKASMCTIQDLTRCGGVNMSGIKYRYISKSDDRYLMFDTSNFDPKYQIDIQKAEKEDAQNGKFLKGTKSADFESLQWVEAPDEDDIGIKVKVHYAGLNAGDILEADEPFFNQRERIYGMDFSGTLENGTRVMGLVGGGAARERLRTRPELLWPAPAQWSLEDAATVPFAYAHALYLLAMKVVLLRESTILVSGGAGATGQAIIAMALFLDCQVFVVVGDSAKKRFLMRIFPKLNADNVFCCRDDSFADRVMLATNGQGCTYVICGKSDHKEAYLRCTAQLGWALDVHQVKRNEEFTYRMGSLTMERSYSLVDFSCLFRQNDLKDLKNLQYLLAKGINDGWVRPLPRVSYEPADTPRAFRLLASGRHRGRVLLRVNAPIGQARLRCSGSRCQLVVCDEAGLGLQLAARLVRGGARAIHLHLMRPSPRLTPALQSWQKMGVKVQTSSGDLTQKESAANLLKQSSSLGPIEGVYMLLTKPTENTRDAHKLVVNNLDLKCRKSCPIIKYFAVIGVNNSIGEQVCISRAATQLPAMMLSVSIDNENENTGSLSASYVDIVNAIERGLLTRQPVIFVRYPTVSESPLTQQIKKIAGICISENIPQTQTLEDLGLTVDQRQELWLYLRDKHNVTILEEKLPLLTVEKIREMETTLMKSDYKRVDGLGAFFQFVYSDELYATLETVVMPTLTQSSDMRDDEFYMSEACLYIVPGMQGLHQPYRQLCERLQLAARVLQPGLDNPNETLQEMTARYVKAFLKKKTNTNTFYLLGHEYGVISALEMAGELEKQGMRGTVFCLGGGPEEFLCELAACTGAGSARALQAAVARHMCALMGLASAELDQALEEAQSWPEKVDASVRALRGRVAHSMQYARLLIEAAYARVTEAQRYAAAPAAPAPHPLQRYSRQPLVVHDLRAPLTRAADDLRAATIINRYLDEDVTKAFLEKSLCQTYLVNRDAFLGNVAYSRAKFTNDVK